MYLKDLNEEQITTFEQALDERRTALAEAATAGQGFEPLQLLLERVAEAEAYLYTTTYAVHLLNRGELTKEAIAVRLMFELTEASDDRWSGRGNDIRRSFSDGKKYAVRRIVEKLLKDSDLV